MVTEMRNRSLWGLGFGAVVAAGGVYLGSTFASGYGSTGLTEWFSAMVALALATLILILLVVFAVLIRWKTTSDDPLFRSVVRTGVLFVAGIAIGLVLAQAF
jgi:hypothetical protein